ncbi:hypothetical protein B0H14DRAFT_2576996 [Mycena olivaceomarginata]|nr:hypothetical protein B0H14DRAFT_2576996 [Mycena olivaceomarginata]
MKDRSACQPTREEQATSAAPGLKNSATEQELEMVTGHAPMPAVLAAVKDPPPVCVLKSAPSSRPRKDISGHVITEDSPAPEDAPKAAMPAAVKDPPYGSLLAMSFASVRESVHPAAAENEGGQGRSMDENLRERESSARDCVPEFQRQKPLHMHSGEPPEGRVLELVACVEAMAHIFPMSCSLPSSALTTCTLHGARTPPSACTGTTVGDTSDLELQEIGINLEAEFGGQVGERSKQSFIESAKYKVLLPLAAPVLAYGERMVELGGRMIGQQVFISNAGPRTFNELKDASICEPIYFSSVTACVPLRHLSVLSSVAAYLDSVLVSTPLRIVKHAYLKHLGVDDAPPYFAWAWEGIGTRTWREFHRRGRATTH